MRWHAERSAHIIYYSQRQPFAIRACACAKDVPLILFLCVCVRKYIGPWSCPVPAATKGGDPTHTHTHKYIYATHIWGGVGAPEAGCAQRGIWGGHLCHRAMRQRNARQRDRLCRRAMRKRNALRTSKCVQHACLRASLLPFAQAPGLG